MRVTIAARRISGSSDMLDRSQGQLELFQFMQLVA